MADQRRRDESAHEREDARPAALPALQGHAVQDPGKPHEDREHEDPHGRHGGHEATEADTEGADHGHRRPHAQFACQQEPPKRPEWNVDHDGDQHQVGRVQPEGLEEENGQGVGGVERSGLTRGENGLAEMLVGIPERDTSTQPQAVGIVDDRGEEFEIVPEVVFESGAEDGACRQHGPADEGKAQKPREIAPSSPHAVIRPPQFASPGSPVQYYLRVAPEHPAITRQRSCPSAAPDSRRVRYLVVATGVAALVAWSLLASVRWRPGWSALTWDDFTRVAIAQNWAAQPFLATGDLVWLPLQAWIYGTGFIVTGSLFADNPMLLATQINSAAIVGAAALLARAAWLLFESTVGGLIVFVTVLFAPWVVFTSLSGLSEPLYYFALATVVWALAARQRGGALGTVAVGSLGVAAAAGVRYEGWLLAPVWVAVVAITLLPSDRSFRPSSLARAWWRGRAVLVVAAAPFLVPAAWMALNAARRGNAFAFRKTTAAMFGSAFGAELFGKLAARLAYYPAGVLGSAPLLVPLLVVLAVIGARYAPRTRLLTCLVALHFGLFYLTSLVSRSVGAFTERFMFAFVLALAPLLGMLPGLLVRVRPWPTRVALSAVLAALLLTETLHGLAHPPEEWTHSPDLLEVGTLLGDLARTRSTPLRVLVGKGFETDMMPLHVQNGRRVSLAPAPGAPADRLPAGADVWIEKLPARIQALPLRPAAIVGRYHLYGAVPASRRGESLGEWRSVDENGIATTIAPFRLVGLEFSGNDPPPGSEVFVERLVPRRDRPRRGSLALRWVYGHGFNFGRLAVEVRVDGRPVFRTDIAAPSRWQTVSFEIPSGHRSSTVAVAVRASDRIERGWEWGRSSTVVVKDFVIVPE